MTILNHKVSNQRIPESH